MSEYSNQLFDRELGKSYSKSSKKGSGYHRRRDLISDFYDRELGKSYSKSKKSYSKSSKSKGKGGHR